MQAIETKYIGPSNYRGSRIKASCERGSITISYPDELNADEAHIAAAQALINKFVLEDAARYGINGKNPWNAKRVMGGLKKTNVHVFVE